MTKPKFCPFCMSGDLSPAVDGHIEMGEWDGKSFESEGSADGWRCNTCGDEFWVNGPTMPSVPCADTPVEEEKKLPLNLKSIIYDLRGPCGNAHAVKGAVCDVLNKIDPALTINYLKRLDNEPLKTYENLIHISREFVEFNWIGLPEGESDVY